MRREGATDWIPCPAVSFFAPFELHFTATRQPNHAQRVGLDERDIAVFCVKRVNCLQYNNKINAGECYNSCGIYFSTWAQRPAGNAILAFHKSLIALFETGRQNTWTTTKTDIRQTLIGRNSQGIATAPRALLMVRSAAVPPLIVHDRRVLPPDAPIATRTKLTTAGQPPAQERAATTADPPQTAMRTVLSRTAETAIAPLRTVTIAIVPLQTASIAVVPPHRGVITAIEPPPHHREVRMAQADHPPRREVRMAQADHPPRRGVRMAQADPPPRRGVRMAQAGRPPRRGVPPPEARAPAPAGAAATVPLAVAMAPARERKRRNAACAFSRGCSSSPRSRWSPSR